MAVGIIGLVMNIAERCYLIVKEIRSFKKQSQRLTSRMKLVIEPIKIKEQIDVDSLEKNEPTKYGRFSKSLEDLKQFVENVEIFLNDLSEKKCLRLLYDKNNISEQFCDFNAILNALVPALTLILVLEQGEEIIKAHGSKKIIEDEADRKEDFNDILHTMNELLKGQEQQGHVLGGIAYEVHDLKKMMEQDRKKLESQAYNQNPSPGLETFSSKDFVGKKLLSNGVYGDLYFACYQPFGTDVAIKELTPKYNKDKDLDKNLLEEAKLLKKFESPHIVKLWGICTGQHKMIVFEYMKFGNLRECLDRPDFALTPDQRLRMALDGTLGLYRIHNLGWLHRDLTTSSFLVDENYRLKLHDLGFSKTWKSAEKSFVVDHTRRQYLAPELINSISTKYDLKCEIYCFGIVLWEIFTGKMPYAGMNGKEIYNFVIEGKTLLIPDDSKKEDLVDRCMNKSLSRRPNMMDISAELKSMQQNLHT